MIYLATECLLFIVHKFREVFRNPLYMAYLKCNPRVYHDSTVALRVSRGISKGGKLCKQTDFH